MRNLHYNPYFEGKRAVTHRSKIRLESGSLVTMMGGGPAGLLLAYFDVFLKFSQLKACMPEGWQAEKSNCHGSPGINPTGASILFADRIAFLGDSGASRLYKDGNGAAFHAAKAATTAVLFGGLKESDIEASFGQMSRTMERDNVAGKLIFSGVAFLKPRRFICQDLWQVITAEQDRPTHQRPMSTMVWDLFTGRAPYQDVLMSSINPLLCGRFLRYPCLILVRRR